MSNHTNNSSQQSLALSTNVLTAYPEGTHEEIKRRFLELMQALVMGLSLVDGPAQGMMVALAPLFLMGMQELSPQIVTKLLQCLSAIVRDVCDLGLSRQQYEDEIEPHIRELTAIVAEIG